MWLFAVAGVVVVGLIGYAAWKGGAPSIYDGFAQCLAEKNVKMYGAWWCSHCAAQKKEFGTSFEYVPYVECSPNGSKTMSVQCENDGITGYPTWVFADGSRLGGERTLEELSQKTGCELPAEE